MFVEYAGKTWMSFVGYIEVGKGILVQERGLIDAKDEKEAREKIEKTGIILPEF
ncbi:MAG: hypothetical protein AB2L13_21025 [Spirochaetota bacterium]